jgi:hypothetical protein
LKKITSFFSLALQVGSNLFLAFGILFLNWNPNDSVAVYFLETLILGILNIPLIVFCGLYGPSRIGPGNSDLISSDKNPMSFEGSARVPSTIKTALFFPVHYGIFFFAQLLAVSFFANFGSSGKLNLNQIFYIFNNIDMNIYTILAGMMVVQLIDFAVFFAKKSYQTTHAIVQMASPYKRIIVQQIAVIFGSFLFSFGLKTAFALLIIAVKIILDVSSRLYGGDEWALLRKREKPDLPSGKPE